MRRWGASLVFTEMISAYGISYRNPRTIAYLRCTDEEHPVGYQLFGTHPSVVAVATERCLQAGADLIDLNMACPVRKVVKTGAGAALLDDPDRAVELVAAVVRAVDGVVPVTVKLRSGVRAGETTVLELAPRLVEAGAAALCLHPRVATQLYKGRADHALTERLATRVSVPVIASGDLCDRRSCEEVLERGAAAAMLARGAIGRPWLFSEVLDGAPPPSVAIRVAELRVFVGDVVAERGERALGHLRQFWPAFRRSGTLPRDLAHRLMLAPSMTEVQALLDEAEGA